MNPSEQLLIATCALSFYAVGQVWLVQLPAYPLWAHVGGAGVSRLSCGVVAQHLGRHSRALGIPVLWARR